MNTGIKDYLARADVRLTADMNMYEASQQILINKASGAMVVDENGKLIWSIKLPNSINLKPLFYKNQIIFKFMNNSIESFDISTGLSLWSYVRQNPPLSINVQSPMVVENDILYSGFPGGKVVIIEPESGSFLTELTMSRP
ncbi:MAG: PQQ-binding-like beta-propeller repeat protein, partial [Gammaproteobacteria bacterium]